MSKPKFVAFALILPVVLVPCAGCGQKSTGPKTYPVTGIVTLKGEPVSGATVTFHGADGKSTAVGTTDAAGRYTLTAGPAGKGALAGKYEVAIVKFKAAEPAPAATAGEYVPPDPNQPPPPAPENLLPAKYADPKTSALTAEVQTSGPGNFDFKLE